MVITQHLHSYIQSNKASLDSGKIADISKFMIEINKTIGVKEFTSLCEALKIDLTHSEITFDNIDKVSNNLHRVLYEYFGRYPLPDIFKR